MLAGLVGAVGLAACGRPAEAELLKVTDPSTVPATPPPSAAPPPSTSGTPTPSASAAPATTAPTTTAATTTPPRALPKGVLAGYWPTWIPDAVRIRDLPAAYGMVHLFAATPAGTDGTLTWAKPGDGRGAATHLREDVAYARATQKRAVLLSIGGAGHGLTFGSRAVSTRFVDSVRRIVDAELGAVDGIDLNTFEAEQAPNTDEYAWVSRTLKATYGKNFLVTAPPAPWSEIDEAFCRDLARAGLLDLCGPQFYDGPGLTDAAYIADTAAHWATLVGADRLYIGFGVIANAPNYLTAAQCATAYKGVAAAVPGVRGAFCWNTSADEAAGWAFAKTVGPLVSA
ncbi:hypothetical protein GCM10009836_65100 [Pseudonocardia ailaonensis]|uniref:GH18 domain-containing protein n=1 Tax=Pseudonocardia ailaonensis TaxID=367279 RepID=A0ABN2NLZ3_9PSEU